MQSAAAESDARALEEVEQREAKLAAALAEAQSSLANMRQLHQASQNQLFTMQSRTEEEAAGMRSEVELATAEMDRAQQRLAALEHEREALLAQVLCSCTPYHCMLCT